jgi:sugar lactone lactonase YvrE
MSKHVLLLALLATSIAVCAQVEVIIGPEAPALKADANGKLPASPLDEPFSVDFDEAGNIWVVEYKGGRIFRMSPDGKLDHLGGVHRGVGHVDGPAMKATFKWMHNGLIAPNGDLLISDNVTHSVRRYRDGKVDTPFGTGKPGFAGDGGPADKAAFNLVMSIGISPDKKTLTIADIKNYRIRAIDLESNVITTIAGNGKRGIPKDGSIATKAPLKDPRAAELDAHGNLFIAERNGNALRKVTPDGKIYTLAGTGKKGYKDGPALQAQFAGPKHLAIDSDGNVYLADDFNNAIRKYDPKTKTVSTILGKGEYKLNRPHGVKVHKGWLYVSDSYNNRILRVKL